jgi:hypothetical protein
VFVRRTRRVIKIRKKEVFLFLFFFFFVWVLHVVR